MFVVPIQTYILIYKKIYEHWGVAGTLTDRQSQRLVPNLKIPVLWLRWHFDILLTVTLDILLIKQRSTLNKSEIHSFGCDNGLIKQV